MEWCYSNSLSSSHRRTETVCSGTTQDVDLLSFKGIKSKNSISFLCCKLNRRLISRDVGFQDLSELKAPL